MHPHDAWSTPPSLLCQESQAILDDDDVTDAGDDDDEYVEMLLDKEINGSGQDCAYISPSNWIKEARSDAIQYILKTSESFGFKIKSAYLAVTYLDRFLSRRQIEGEKYWALRLLAIACLSLAAKVEEYRAPLLSEFNGEENSFESRVIQRMELLVLDTLEWRIAITTPLTYVHYFVSKFFENNTQMRETVSKVIEIISIAIKNFNLIHHRPSTITAAATLLILDGRLTRDYLEDKINALSFGGSLERDDIISFYNQMKELDILSPNRLQRTNKALENSSVTTSGLNIKRKSLTFTDKGDQNMKVPHSKRHC